MGILTPGHGHGSGGARSGRARSNSAHGKVCIPCHVPSLDRATAEALRHLCPDTRTPSTDESK